jgi:dTDP-glucose 4,6-dehydratase
MNILVTGGAGFIGSNFIRYMLHKYDQYLIVNLDCLTYAGNPENLQDVQNDSRYVFIEGDICNKELVHHIMKSFHIDVVVNFAAESHVDRSISDAEIFVRTNVMGTHTLIEAAKHHRIRKFVQISTDEVYGSLGETGLFSEQTPLSPNSPYSASKASADMMVNAFYETFGMNVNITRCSNNYGPFHYPEKLIPLMITNALEGKKLPVYGDGLNIRDWLHVADHASAIDLVLHEGIPGEVYNIGGSTERRNIDIVKLILEQLGKKSELIEFVADRLGHDRRYAIDPTKIEQHLCWKPKYTFEKGIAETIRWYIEHPDWWRKIKDGKKLPAAAV